MLVGSAAVSVAVVAIKIVGTGGVERAGFKIAWRALAAAVLATVRRRDGSIHRATIYLPTLVPRLFLLYRDELRFIRADSIVITILDTVPDPSATPRAFASLGLRQIRRASECSSHYALQGRR